MRNHRTSCLRFGVYIALVVACAAIGLSATLLAQAGLGLSWPPVNEPGLFHDKKAFDLFTAARIAISGGPNGITRLQSLRFKGRSRVPGPDGQIFDGIVEIRIQLPDKYLRIDSGTFGRRLSGYAGNTSLALLEDSDKRVIAEPKDADTVTAARYELARLMLVAATWTSHEVKVQLFTRDAPIPLDSVQDIPGGTDPLSIDAITTDGGGFRARLFMDPKSRMPARVVHGNGTQTVTMAVLERQAAGGYKLPSHIVVTTGGEHVIDELMFDEIVINPKFTKADFVK
jgi:hypothetical protein